jgi:hypothetical protein
VPLLVEVDRPPDPDVDSDEVLERDVVAPADDVVARGVDVLALGDPATATPA